MVALEAERAGKIVRASAPFAIMKTGKLPRMRRALLDVHLDTSERETFARLSLELRELIVDVSSKLLR